MSEPFGYFRCLGDYGWEDCSESDEGAIALYEHPHHAEDRLEMVMPDVRLTDDEASLLEALKLLLDQVEHGDDEVWVLNKVRAVIRRCEAKKAGGAV